MTVYFIGAGPGAADLLTLRADRLIRTCDMCLYAGSIVPDEVLAHTPEGAEVINTARMPLEEIIATIIRADSEGKNIARLHSGDPTLYSAVAEQIRRLTEAGIAYEIVPGVPAFSAAAASLGHELTVPTVGQTVILTRVSGRASAMPEGEDLPTLGASGATMVIHLAVVAFASRPAEVIVRGTLADIAEQVELAGITRTAVIIVGRVLQATEFPDSFLYSDDRPRDDEGRTIPCMH